MSMKKAYARLAEATLARVDSLPQSERESISRCYEGSLVLLRLFVSGYCKLTATGKMRLIALDRAIRIAIANPA